jgi:hypothetical protein
MMGSEVITEIRQTVAAMITFYIVTISVYTSIMTPAVTAKHT